MSDVNPHSGGSSPAQTTEIPQTSVSRNLITEVGTYFSDMSFEPVNTALRSRKYVAMVLSTAVASTLFSPAAMGWLAYVAATSVMSAGIYAVFYHFEGANILRNGIKLPAKFKYPLLLSFNTDYDPRILELEEYENWLDKVKLIFMDIVTPEKEPGTLGGNGFTYNAQGDEKDKSVTNWGGALASVARVAFVYLSFYAAAKALITVATPALHAVLALAGPWGLLAGYAVTLAAFYVLGKVCSTNKSPAETARTTELLTTLLLVGLSVTALIMFTPVSLLVSLLSSPAIAAMALPLTLLSCVGVNAASKAEMPHFKLRSEPAKTEGFSVNDEANDDKAPLLNGSNDGTDPAATAPQTGDVGEFEQPGQPGSSGPGSL